jgi:hypothetical protein
MPVAWCSTGSWTIAFAVSATIGTCAAGPSRARIARVAASSGSWGGADRKEQRAERHDPELNETDHALAAQPGLVEGDDLGARPAAGEPRQLSGPERLGVANVLVDASRPPTMRSRSPVPPPVPP